jgi:hypothetical protein
MIPIQDSLTDGQPDSGTRVLIISVETLEEAKNVLLILVVNPDSIVANRE